MFTTSFTWNDFVFMLDGALVTVKLTMWAALIGTVVGILAGLLRYVFPRATWPLAWILDIFRSVPLIVQFVLFNSFKSILNVDLSAFEVACIVLGIYTGAYCCEIVRSGLESVPHSLYRAGRSLGMSGRQCILYIIAPLAIRVSLPGWINVVLSVMKDTSLVLWIGIAELLRNSQTIVTRIQEPILVLGIAGVMYYVMSLAIARVGHRIEKRWQEND